MNKVKIQAESVTQSGEVKEDLMVSQIRQTPPEVNRLVRTSAAMIGLSISVGAYSLPLPNQNNEEVAAELLTDKPTANAMPSEFDGASVPNSFKQTQRSFSTEIIAHPVQEGQTLWQLARYGVDAAKLALDNGLSANVLLHVGQVEGAEAFDNSQKAVSSVRYSHVETLRLEIVKLREKYQVSSYAHNSQTLVHEGQKVAQGQQFADMGSTDYSTELHSHFESHLAGQGVINPMAHSLEDDKTGTVEELLRIQVGIRIDVSESLLDRTPSGDHIELPDLQLQDDVVDDVHDWSNTDLEQIILDAVNCGGLANYSNYGYGLDSLTPNSTSENLVLSKAGACADKTTGFPAATAKVAGSISHLWAANSNLIDHRFLEILKHVATDTGKRSISFLSSCEETRLAQSLAMQSFELASTAQRKFLFYRDLLTKCFYGEESSKFSFGIEISQEDKVILSKAIQSDQLQYLIDSQEATQLDEFKEKLDQDIVQQLEILILPRLASWDLCSYKITEKHENLGSEYFGLSRLISLSDEQADRISQIYELAETDPILNFLINEIDCLILNNFNLLREEKIHHYENQQARLKEFLPPC